MTDALQGQAKLVRLTTGPRPSFDDAAALTQRRYTRERRVKALGLAAIGIAVALLALLLSSVIRQGYSAFWQTYIRLDISLEAAKIDPDGTGDPAVIARADLQPLINAALYGQFPEVEGRQDRRALRGIVSSGAGLILRDELVANPEMVGQTVPIWVIASDVVDQLVKGAIDRELPEGDRPIDDLEIAWVDELDADGRIETRFNSILFTRGDSREPELAGIWGAVVGSFYMMLVTFLLSVPIGVAAATYLEEFAPKNRLTDLIEVNINNLAAVPSIVFGLLGLAVFIQVFNLPRSAPIVGGLTLTLMTLPTIVVATRAALRAVPPSIREAALGMGASKVQTISHFVLPLALPGILTGSIIGMAQALGESAPLLMIGMIAFVVDVPGSPFDPSTALPVQVYLWADSPERAFTERTGAAIIVLLGFLVIMNALAVILRKRFERTW